VDIRSGTFSLQGGGSFLAGTATNSVGFLQLNSANYTLNGTVTTTNFQLAGATLTGNNVINGSLPGCTERWTTTPLSRGDQWIAKHRLQRQQ